MTALASAGGLMGDLTLTLARSERLRLRWQISAQNSRSVSTVFRDVVKAFHATFGLDLAIDAPLWPFGIGAAQVGATRIQRITHGFLLCCHAYDVEIVDQPFGPYALSTHVIPAAAMTPA